MIKEKEANDKMNSLNDRDSTWRQDIRDLANWAYNKGKKDEERLTLGCHLIKPKFKVGDMMHTPEGINRKVKRIGGAYYELDANSQW